jgi:hypothetical protein
MCHSQGLNVLPVVFESHSTLSPISHVTLENLTQVSKFPIDFNAASENHQDLSPPWQHDTALHQTADGRDSLQMWRVASNINKKQ